MTRPPRVHVSRFALLLAGAAGRYPRWRFTTLNTDTAEVVDQLPQDAFGHRVTGSEACFQGDGIIEHGAVGGIHFRVHQILNIFFQLPGNGYGIRIQTAVIEACIAVSHQFRED